MLSKPNHSPSFRLFGWHYIGNENKKDNKGFSVYSFFHTMPEK